MSGAMETDGAEPASGMQLEAAAAPERGFVEAIKAKPGEIKQWWADLTAVFDKSFLALICSVYFLQGCGNLPTLVTKYYLRNSPLEGECVNDPEKCNFGAAFVGNSECCHIGLGANVTDHSLLYLKHTSAVSSAAVALPNPSSLLHTAGLAVPDQTTVLTFIGLPWNYKIIYGLLSDGYPLFGFHRRSYIMMAGAVGVVGFIGTGMLGNDADPSTVQFLLMLTTLSIAFCDVCTDALVASNAKLESETGAGNLQSLCWVRTRNHTAAPLFVSLLTTAHNEKPPSQASLGFGGMVISICAGPIYEVLDIQWCFFVSALIPAGRMFLAWRLQEPAAKPFDPAIIKDQTSKIIKTLCHPGVHRPIIYAFLSWCTIPKLSDGQFNFFVDGDNTHWTATLPSGAPAYTSNFTSLANLDKQTGSPPALIDCQWFMENDKGCAGDWVDQLTSTATNPTVDVLVAGKKHPQSVPQGYEVDPLAGCFVSACECQLHTDFSMFDVDEDRRVALEEVQALLGPDVTSLSDEEITFTVDRYRELDSDGDGDITKDDFKHRGPEHCTELVRLPVAGLSKTTLEEACSMMALGRDCQTFDVSQYVDGAAPGTTLEQVCPMECNAAMDACGVAGGDGSSCAVQVLAQAWAKCPMACTECDTNKRGCMGFSSFFMSSLGIFSYGSLMSGSLIYMAYFKAVPHRKLLFAVQVLIAIFGFMDFLAVYAAHQEDHTVLGIDAHFFAVTDEVLNDVLNQMKYLPLMVMGAQVCPDAIEGTLFAFFMQMSNSGKSYSGFFGSWLQKSLQITLLDYMGLQTGQLLVFFFKLAPCLFLWLVPLGDPAVAAKEIDRELNATPEEPAEAPPATANGGMANGHAPEDKGAPDANPPKLKLGGLSNMAVIWVFVLVALLPPFRSKLPLSDSGSFEIMAVPPFLLVIIPLYQMFLQPLLPSSNGKKKASGGGLSEGLTAADSAANPVGDADQVTPL